MITLRRTGVHPGQVLAGRFRLDEPIAGGGMGEVWRGLDLDAAREHTGPQRVAVKVLRPDLRTDRVFFRRLAAEAANLSALDHPAIARFVAHGSSRDVDFLAMEHVPGAPLHTFGPLPPARTAEILAVVANALDHAHRAGIVHRDVKPANILLDPSGPDAVHVTDFGIALGHGSTDLTDPGRVMGTAEYMAPERVRGAASSPATDIYALGVTAFEVLAGYRPYDGANPVAIALKHVSDPVPPLPARVPAPLAHLVSTLLAKDPQARPSSAAAVAEHLATLARDGSLSTASARTSPAGAKEDPW